MRFLKSREMKGNWIIVALTGFVLMLTAILTFRLHHANKNQVLSQFKDHQFLHAQNIAKQIELLLTGYAKNLQVLSSLISSHQGDIEQQKATLQVYQKYLDLHVLAISFSNELGERIYSARHGAAGFRDHQSELTAWAKKKENRGEVFVLTLVPSEETTPDRPPGENMERGLRILLATPVYEDAHRSRMVGRFAGLLTFTVDLKEFLEVQLGFFDPQTNLQQVWIIDKSGTLLLQSEHQEMVSMNVYRKEARCLACHLSLDYVEKFLREREGTGDYQLKNLPKKFAAFAPMDFENASWTVVVNSAHDDMMAYTRNDLKGHFVLLGIVALAFGISSTFIIRNYRSIVKAEEEARHWRDKRSLEEKIRQSEVLYRTIVETAHDLIWILDEEGRFTFANKRAEAILDYSGSDLIGKNIISFIHPEDLPKMETRFLSSLQDGLQYSEFRFLGRDGKVPLLSVNTAFLRDGSGIRGTVSFCRDITQEKQAEIVLKESEERLRHLSAQLLTAQDTERRRISRELHDELGGALAVLKLRLSLISKGLHQDQSGLREDCSYLLSYIDQIIENVRRLIKDLSPPVLEDLGLTAALQSLITNFMKSHDMKMKSGLIGIDHLFSPRAQIIVYRMIQEALNNVRKHSQAKNVMFTVEEGHGRVSFVVADDGKGFDPLRVVSRNPSEKGLGLDTMYERARMLGGTVHLRSEEGKGTQIRFNIPSMTEEK